MNTTTHTAPDADDGLRERWQEGERPFFEYHGDTSPTSVGAPLVPRTRQQVTIIRGLVTDGADDWTLDERIAEGMTGTYTIRFPDGHIGTAFEDELLTNPQHYSDPK